MTIVLKKVSPLRISYSKMLSKPTTPNKNIKQKTNQKSNKLCLTKLEKIIINKFAPQVSRPPRKTILQSSPTSEKPNREDAKKPRKRVNYKISNMLQ